MSFDEIPFEKTPNFCNKAILSEKADCIAVNCNFEVFKNKNDQKTYLVTLLYQVDKEPLKFTLQIQNLEDNKIIKELEGHEDRILNVRYFYNEEKQKEYLVSADKKNIVIVWDITDDYKILKKITFKFDMFIYSNVLIFKNDSIFLITSSKSFQNTAKIVDITKNEEPKDIISTKDFPIYYLLVWHNINDNKDFLIVCGKKIIKIIELFSQNLRPFIREFKTEEQYNMGGLIYNYKNKDYFISTNTLGEMLKINLENMEQVGKKEKFDVCNFYNIIQWNEKYFLILDSAYKRIIVMGLEDCKIKSKMIFPELSGPRYMKKVIHPIYGESLLVICTDCKLYLFTDRDITKFKD